MLYYLLFVLVSRSAWCTADASDASDLGDDLVPKLKNDKNLDLSEDPEYEDLRSEFLAYRTVLDSIGHDRRSLISTPCANMGGICINSKLCPGFRQLTEVRGCKSHQQVCCFVWNIYNVRDQSEHGFANLRYPWLTEHAKFGGKGVVLHKIRKKQKKRKKGKKNRGKGQGLLDS